MLENLTLAKLSSDPAQTVVRHKVLDLSVWSGEGKETHAKLNAWESWQGHTGGQTWAWQAHTLESVQSAPG